MVDGVRSFISNHEINQITYPPRLSGAVLVDSHVAPPHLIVVLVVHLELHSARIEHGCASAMYGSGNDPITAAGRVEPTISR